MSGLYTLYRSGEMQIHSEKRSPSPLDRTLLCDRSIWIVLSPDWLIRQIPSFGFALLVQLFIVFSMLERLGRSSHFFFKK